VDEKLVKEAAETAKRKIEEDPTVGNATCPLIL
jgi:hypothetical protein